MEANNNSKAREVLNRVHKFLSNLCRDARCDEHCSECLGASDLADDVYDLLHTPRRNCDVGTAEEQGKRCMAQFDQWRRKGDGMKLITAIMTWAQTPYEEEGAK